MIFLYIFCFESQERRFSWFSILCSISVTFSCFPYHGKLAALAKPASQSQVGKSYIFLIFPQISIIFPQTFLILVLKGPGYTTILRGTHHNGDITTCACILMGPFSGIVVLMAGFSLLTKAPNFIYWVYFCRKVPKASNLGNDFVMGGKISKRVSRLMVRLEVWLVHPRKNLFEDLILPHYFCQQKQWD